MALKKEGEGEELFMGFGFHISLITNVMSEM